MSSSEPTLAQMQAHYVEHMTTPCECPMFGTDVDEIQGYFYAEGPGYTEFTDLAKQAEKILRERSEEHLKKRQPRGGTT